MDTKTIIKQIDFNYSFAKELVEDVTEDQMYYSPGPGLENHPSFTLGHLAVASAMTVRYLGGKSETPELWRELFKRNGPGDPRFPEKDHSLYPNKEALLDELYLQHERLKEALLIVNKEYLKEDKKWRFNNYLPSVLDCTIFMCLNHESMHLGQLSAWRRAMGLPSALGRM